MPSTFLSHQAPVVALKIRWPSRFDGVALVVGSMAPDFSYVLSGTAYEFDAHGPVGMIAFAVPVAVVLAGLLRARVAAVFFTLAPSLGGLRLNDWRVLAARRPSRGSTVFSAAVGALTHSLWDTFTHDQRAGARLLPALRETLFTLGALRVSLARTLQYIGHAFGAAVTVALLWHIARAGLLARWYGRAYEALGPLAPPRGHRLALAVVLTAAGAAGCAWGLGANVSGFIVRVGAAMALGLTGFAHAVGDHAAYRPRG